MSEGSARREEILQAAARLFADEGITASIHQLADACGILPGSLYHHFDSKEAIVVELVARYRADLDSVADEALAGAGAASPEERIVGLATAIAACAIRHRAAVVLTYFEPPTRSGEELSMSAGIDPGVSTRRALTKVLQGTSADGFLQPEIDSVAFASYLWQEMVQIAMRRYQTASSDQRMPELKCRILLHGLAAQRFEPAGTTKALEAADEAMATWDTAVAPDEDPKRTAIVAAARAEFARRGYEATTVRDVASAAGVSARSTYRMVGSKEELLVATMSGYATYVLEGWKRVIAAERPAVETIDALSWLYLNALDRFSEEHKIQFQTLTRSPNPSTQSNWAFPTQLRMLKDCLDEGTRSGDLGDRPAGLDLWARTVFALLHTPETTLKELGPSDAFALTRATVLNGAARRG
ncbi:MAG TPA: TetR/AcrR family transcriptional regulator [Acidimicrobiales bacterium]